MIQFILEHKKDILALLTSIHVAVVHVYISVCHAGGYRSLWRNFQGSKSSALVLPTATAESTKKPGE